jgi:hypothetical protein
MKYVIASAFGTLAPGASVVALASLETAPDGDTASHRNDKLKGLCISNIRRKGDKLSKINLRFSYIKGIIL